MHVCARASRFTFFHSHTDQLQLGSRDDYLRYPRPSAPHRIPWRRVSNPGNKPCFKCMVSSAKVDDNLHKKGESMHERFYEYTYGQGKSESGQPCHHLPLAWQLPTQA